MATSWLMVIFPVAVPPLERPAVWASVKSMEELPVVEFEAGGGEERGDHGQVDGLGVCFGGAVEVVEGLSLPWSKKTPVSAAVMVARVTVAGFGIGGEVDVAVAAGDVEDAFGSECFGW